MAPVRIAREIRLGEIVIVVSMLVGLGGGYAALKAEDRALQREVEYGVAYDNRQDRTIEEILSSAKELNREIQANKERIIRLESRGGN